MNKAQRKAIAARLKEIAERHGGMVRVDHEIERLGLARRRSIRMEFEFRHVRASTNIDDLHRGGILINWFYASRPLAIPGPFNSVNDCHRGKATMYEDSAEQMYPAFERACSAVADGSAFDDSWKPAPRRCLTL